MSSSQANASARRRRAAPSTVPAPGASNGRPQQVEPGQQGQGPTSIRAPLTPTQMLIAHDRRISELERIVSGEDMSPTNVQAAAPSQDVEIMARRLAALEMSIQNQQSQQGNVFAEQAESQRIMSLENKIAELEATLRQVQKFAMETNFTLMKYKNGMDAKLACEITEAQGTYENPTFPTISHDAISGDAIESTTESTTKL